MSDNFNKKISKVASFPQKAADAKPGNSSGKKKMMMTDKERQLVSAGVQFAGDREGGVLKDAKSEGGVPKGAKPEGVAKKTRRGGKGRAKGKGKEKDDGGHGNESGTAPNVPW
jgi:hypothetical protein